jgi:hypothetical protein
MEVGVVRAVGDDALTAAHLAVLGRIVRDSYATLTSAREVSEYRSHAR